MNSFLGALRVFHEVVRAGSVRAASDALGLSASSVSRQIQHLEHQIGAALLDRSASGVAPTHAGKQVAEFARSVLMEYDALRADVNERRGMRGNIRVAAVESTIGRAVAATAAFRAKHDGVTFTLTMMPAGKVIEAVKSAEVDVGVTFCCDADPALTILASFSEPIILAVGPNHEWALRPSISLGELALVPIGLPETTFGVRRIIDEVVRKARVTLSPAMESNSFEALRAFARLGGASLLPRLSIESDRRANILKSLLVDCRAFNETTADMIALRKRRPSRLLKLFYGELERVALL
jgi:DNA-binding transcriptional LysR family regulator